MKKYLKNRARTNMNICWSSCRKKRQGLPLSRYELVRHQRHTCKEYGWEFAWQTRDWEIKTLLAWSPLWWVRSHQNIGRRYRSIDTWACSRTLAILQSSSLGSLCSSPRVLASIEQTRYVKGVGSYNRKELVLLTFMTGWKGGYQLPPTRGEVVPLIIFDVPLKLEEEMEKG